MPSTDQPFLRASPGQYVSVAVLIAGTADLALRLSKDFKIISHFG
jgi:hypothetical protein